MIKTFILHAILSMGLAAALAASADAHDSAATMGRSLNALAHVKLKSRNGRPIMLGSRVDPDKPTLVSIWASWCAPCVAEAPYLDKLRKDLGTSYNFIYINRRDGNPDPEQPPAAIAQFLASTGMRDVDYVTADVKAYRQIVGADLRDLPEGMVGIPRVYLFDRDGKEIYTSLGFRYWDILSLEQRVKQAMAK